MNDFDFWIYVTSWHAQQYKVSFNHGYFFYSERSYFSTVLASNLTQIVKVASKIKATFDVKEGWRLK